MPPSRFSSSLRLSLALLVGLAAAPRLAALPPPPRDLLELELRELGGSGAEALLSQERQEHLAGLLRRSDARRRRGLDRLVAALGDLQGAFEAWPERPGHWTPHLDPIADAAVEVFESQLAVLEAIDVALTPTERMRWLKRWTRRFDGHRAPLATTAFEAVLAASWRSFVDEQRLRRPGLVARAHQLWEGHGQALGRLLARYRQLRARVEAVDLRGHPTRRGRVLEESRELARVLAEELRAGARGLWQGFLPPERGEAAVVAFAGIRRLAWVTRRFHPLAELDRIP